LRTFYPGEQVREDEEGEGIVLGGAPSYPWDGTDRDYKYEEVFDASLCNINYCPIGDRFWWHSATNVNSYKICLRVLGRTRHPQGVSSLFHAIYCTKFFITQNK
jgi:hypothetical protein